MSIFNQPDGTKVDPRWPLGVPTNRKVEECDKPEEWLKTDNPKYQRNSKTGRLRNVTPSPPK